MRSDVSRDFEYSNQFKGAIRRVCEILYADPSLVRVQQAPMEIDMKQATDWLVVHIFGKTIASRVRRPGFLDKFHFQFTIRSRRISKMRTELAKIVEDGFGDSMIYAHDDGSGSRFSAWRAISLHEFRKHPQLWYRAPEIPNEDKVSFFRAYDVRNFPPPLDLVIKSSGHRRSLILGEANPRGSDRLYDHNKTFNDQSMEYYEARAKEDFVKETTQAGKREDAA